MTGVRTVRWPDADAHLAEADDVMAGLVEAHGPLEIDLIGDRFEALGLSILHQQLAGPAARTITDRVVDLFDGDFPTPDRLLAADGDDLAACGVSAQKRRYLTSLARHVADGDLDLAMVHELGDEEAVEALTQVTGVGRWTAEMFLMFTLARKDVLPVGDLGLRRGVEHLYGFDEEPTHEEVRKVAAPWRPYRSAGTWYVWRARDGEAALAEG